MDIRSEKVNSATLPKEQLMQRAFGEKVPSILFSPDETASATSGATSGKEQADGQAAKSILVVDDDLDIRFVVQIFMQISGYKVRTATNGIEALHQVTLEVPDLIILDISMADLNGLEVLRLIRVNTPTARMPIILLSAHSSDADIAAGMALGANHYVTKPFEPSYLLSVVEQLLSPGK
jgi:CheY-like chemotaxis protein